MSFIEKIKTDKRGDVIPHMTMALYYLGMIVVIVGGTILSLYIFFGSGYDYRSADASVLAYKLEKCIVEKEISANFWDNLYEKCDIKKEIIEESFVIGISMDGKKVFKTGDSESCMFEAQKAKDYPVCSSRSFQKGNVNFDVSAGSSQRGRAMK